MARSAVRICLFFLSAALLTGIFVAAARADGPALTAVFGIAGHYRPGGWIPVTVTIRNPGADTLSGQLQVLTADTGSQPVNGRPSRSQNSSVTFACPVTVPGGGPSTFTLYLRGIDPGQADLTLRFAEGRERGDGRVFAEINTLNPKTSEAFTGSPVGNSDRFLIGFGGDPSAFTFLNGRRWGGTGAPNPVSAMPSTLQVAGAAASDLPDKAAGYAGIDAFLLRSDAPLERLTEAQIEALKGWVASGGHLIVCGGADATRFGDTFYQNLLPAIVGSAGATSSLKLTSKPLSGVLVTSALPEGTPLIISGPFGAGSVTLTAYDPTSSPYQPAGQAALSPSWQTLLAGSLNRSASVVHTAEAREENEGSRYYGNQTPLLSEAVMRGPSLDAPAVSIIGAFLLVYLIVLVPVNYLVLKRFDRKEWAWATIPLLVIIFAVGTYGVGYAAKGGSVFINRASIIETSAGRQEAGVYADVGLFSPHRTSYDISLLGANLTAALPNSGQIYGGRTEMQPVGPAKFVVSPAGVTLPDTPVNMWAMRAFDVQSTQDLGGTFDGTLSQTNGTLTGNLVNHTPYTLTDCTVWFGGRSSSLGTLAQGSSLGIKMTGSSSGSPFDVALGSSGGTRSQANIHERMRSAIAEYYHSLGSTLERSSSGQSSAALPGNGEAILLAWSNASTLAGPAPQIDGHSVTENDVSLVIVHIPVVAGK